MKKHRFFDILLPPDPLLEHELGKSVTERQTLHEWPLSCVELVTCSDSSKYISKSISGPIIEPDFYQRASSTLLPRCQTIYRDERHATMLLEFLHGTRLDEEENPPAVFLDYSIEVTERIRELPTDVPVFMRLDSADAWLAVHAKMCRDLEGLLARETYTITSSSTLERLQRHGQIPALLKAFSNNSGLIHADLTAQNIFRDGGGFRVIDWQFPRLGPRQLDIAIFLESLNLSSLLYVEPQYTIMMYLIRIEWLIQCSDQWFPQGSTHYDAQVAHLANEVDAIVNKYFPN